MRILQNRHKSLVSELNRLEQERHRKQSRGSFSSLSLNLINHSSKLSSDNLYDGSSKESDNSYSSYEVGNAVDSQRSHDGVFLRPVAVAR